MQGRSFYLILEPGSHHCLNRLIGLVTATPWSSLVVGLLLRLSPQSFTSFWILSHRVFSRLSSHWHCLDLDVWTTLSQLSHLTRAVIALQSSSYLGSSLKLSHTHSLVIWTEQDSRGHCDRGVRLRGPGLSTQARCSRIKGSSPHFVSLICLLQVQLLVLERGWA